MGPVSPLRVADASVMVAAEKSARGRVPRARGRRFDNPLGGGSLVTCNGEGFCKRGRSPSSRGGSVGERQLETIGTGGRIQVSDLGMNRITGLDSHVQGYGIGRVHFVPCVVHRLTAGIIGFGADLFHGVRGSSVTVDANPYRRVRVAAARTGDGRHDPGAAYVTDGTRLGRVSGLWQPHSRPSLWLPKEWGSLPR